MDIEDAIAKVKGLHVEIARCGSFLDDKPKAQVLITTRNLSPIVVDDVMTEEGIRALVLRKHTALVAERAKLMAVIDMANAALKGIGA